jgi:hypothetical protein
MDNQNITAVLQVVLFKVKDKLSETEMQEMGFASLKTIRTGLKLYDFLSKQENTQ